MSSSSPSADRGPSLLAQPLRFTASAFLARNATWNLLADGWIFLVLLVAMPHLVHVLGEAQFGLFSLAWVAINYLGFLDIGVNRAVTKFVSEHLAAQDAESVRQVIRTALFANLALGLSGGAGVVLLSPSLIRFVLKLSEPLAGQAQLTFLAVGIAVPVLLVQGVLRAVLSSLQRFGWINGVDALAAAAQWGGAWFLAARGHGVALVVFSTVLARAGAVAAYGAVLSRSVPDLRWWNAGSFSGLGKLLRFGSWVSVSQLTSPLLAYADRILIASFLSLPAVTLYAVPYEVITRVRVIPSGLMGTLYPAFSERSKSDGGQALQRLYEGSIRYLSLLLLPGILFLAVFSRDVLTLWMGPAFAGQSTVALQILAVGALANSLAYVPYGALQASGRPDLTGKFHLLELPLHLILCLVLIPRWGIAGAALASTLRFVLDAALLFWGATRYCRCAWPPLWHGRVARMIVLACALLVSLGGVRWAVPQAWLRLGLGATLCAFYFLAAWFLIVAESEKPGISGALRMALGQPAS